MSNTGRILFIDNEDSFVYNLVDAYGARGHAIDVFRCDWPTPEALDYITEHKPDLVVLSPGPRGPKDARLCNELLESAPADLPIFGVCLGFQCIVEHFGGSVQPTGSPAHGKAAMITHDDGPTWTGVENPFVAGRYHSLAATRIPDVLRVTARMNEMAMAVQHVSRPVIGVQFHPESVLTPSGQTILDNVMEQLSGGPSL